MLYVCERGRGATSELSVFTVCFHFYEYFCYRQLETLPSPQGREPQGYMPGLHSGHILTLSPHCGLATQVPAVGTGQGGASPPTVDACAHCAVNPRWEPGRRDAAGRSSRRGSGRRTRRPRTNPGSGQGGPLCPSGPGPEAMLQHPAWFALGAAALLLPSGVWRLLSRDRDPQPRVFSRDELSRYRGGDGSPGLYLAVLGLVFDVAAGGRHYGPGGAYHRLAGSGGSGLDSNAHTHPLPLFTGRDASQAFVSGDFTESGLVDDVSGLSPAEMLSLHNWLTFYKREYIYRGKLAGTFYNQEGEPTQALIDAELVIEQGRKLKAESEVENQVFPPCNSEWTSNKGGRVWCSTHSGGIKRNWIGVPRKLYKTGSKNYRCVCVRTNPPDSAHRGDLDNPLLQEYPGCQRLADSCAVMDG
ncbi:neuferricin [Narcine bancroftii]|uniref:neuferricin n=1 Tax=Narcine bancroftii TaxID=1343680 RepID=UPI003831BF8F